MKISFNMAFMQNGATFVTRLNNVNMQTNSMHTSVNESVHQGKTHQVKNSHDGKQLATTT